MDHSILILNSMLKEIDLGTQFNNVSGGGSISISQLDSNRKSTGTENIGRDPMLDKDGEGEKHKHKKLIKRHYCDD